MSYYNNRNDYRKRQPWGPQTNDEPKNVMRFAVTIADKTFVRNSPKVFSHAVVGHKEGKPFECLKWCTSAVMAEQQAEFHKGIGYLEVQVIEATASKYVKEYLSERR